MFHVIHFCLSLLGAKFFDDDDDHSDGTTTNPRFGSQNTTHNQQTLTRNGPTLTSYNLLEKVEPHRLRKEGLQRDKRLVALLATTCFPTLKKRSIHIIRTT